MVYQLTVSVLNYLKGHNEGVPDLLYFTDQIVFCEKVSAE